MSQFMEFLQSVLGGQAGAAGQPQRPMGPPPVSTNTQPRQAPPYIPQRVPVPQPRPMQAPQGSLSPARGAPMPQQRPQPQPIERTPIQPQMTAQPQQQPGFMENIQNILSGTSSGGDWRQMARAVGSGMSNADPRAPDDPWAAFGSGFGGAQEYYGERDQTKAEQALEQEKMEYERSRQEMMDSHNMSQDEAMMELRRATDSRSAKRDELLNKKTAREIEKMSKETGIDVGELLEIERIAQAAGENIIDPEERQSTVEATRQRLMTQVAGRTGGDRTGGGDLSAGPGVTGGNNPRARNPDTGEVMEHQPGKGWVPVT